MSQLIDEFSKKPGVEIHLVLYGLKRDIFYKIPDSVHIHRPAFSFNNNFRLFYTLRTLLFLRRRIKHIHPDTVLSFGELWNNFVLLALYGTSYPVYVSDRCQPNKSFGKLHDNLRKWLYPKAKGVIAQTQLAKNIYQKQFNHSNIKVIGNPIRKIPKDSEIQKENIVLTVGRLIETKHHDQLINTFLNVRMPNWRLEIVGDDALKQKNRSKLGTLIQRKGAEQYVSLEGRQENVESYYLKSKIFAFSSSSEGFPNVVGEAQAAGLPVVSFDCVAGPSDMIEDGVNGYLVPVFDWEKFGKKLAVLMEREEKRKKMGEQARKTIQEFSASVIANKYFKLITL